MPEAVNHSVDADVMQIGRAFHTAKDLAKSFRSHRHVTFTIEAVKLQDEPVT